MEDAIPEAFLGLMAERFRMLGDSTRLTILRTLMSGERSVGQVVAETGQSQANVSKHLRMLADSGLVARRKSGLHVYYSVNDPLIGAICGLACRSLMNEAKDRVEKDGRLLDVWRADK